MKKYEYKVLKMDLSSGVFSSGGKVDVDLLGANLAKLGNEGWELVNTVDTTMKDSSSGDLILIFKKEKLVM